MSKACPVNFTTIDNTVSRIVSLMTFVIVIAAVSTQSALLFYLLGTDLVIRLYGNKQYSILFNAASALKRIMHLKTKSVDGASKNVAGHFGLLFIVLLIGTLHLGLSAGMLAITAVFAVCLLLDVVFDFCMGCKVYHLYRILCRIDR